MSEIKSALTPEEWAEEPAGSTVVDGYVPWENGTVDVRETYPNRGRFRHALAALALHGQEFGFTWDDVDALREATVGEWSRYMDDPPEYDEDEEAMAILRSLADRIAALLPPREGGGDAQP